MPPMKAAAQSEMVERLRAEGNLRVNEKEMVFGDSKSRADRIADDLCYQAADEIERLQRELAETLAASRGGYWTATVSDCAPPRSRRDNPLKNARSIRLSGPHVTEADALEAADAAIKSGWANGHIIIDKQTAKASASFNLSHASIDAIGRARDGIRSASPSSLTQQER